MTAGEPKAWDGTIGWYAPELRDTVQEFRQRVTIIIGTVVALVSWLSSFAMFWYAVVVQEIAVGRVIAAQVLFIFIAAVSTAIVRGKDA